MAGTTRAAPWRSSSASSARSTARARRPGAIGSTIEISVQRREAAREERQAALEHGRYARYGREVARAGCDHRVFYVDPRGGPEGLRLLADEVAIPLHDEFGA